MRGLGYIDTLQSLEQPVYTMGLDTKLTPHLKLCASTISLGNTIAVHFLDYLSAVKTQDTAFEELAIDFLNTSRILFRAKDGIKVSTTSKATALPSINDANDLLERLRRVSATFSVVDQLVKRKLKSEEKHGFSRLGNGFRMMGTASGVEKIRKALTQDRDSLRIASTKLPTDATRDDADSANGIGYTALIAVFESRLQKPATPEAPPRIDLPLREKQVAVSTHVYPQEMGRQSIPPQKRERGMSAFPIVEEVKLAPRKGCESPILGTADDTVSLSTMSNQSLRYWDDRSSRREIDSVFSSYTARPPMDSRAAPRWSPKWGKDEISPAQRSALVDAVRTMDHTTMESLLDCGVPVDGEPEENLLRYAVSTFDLDAVRLLLLFGANSNAKDHAGLTPLYTATEVVFLEGAKMLLRYGADPNLSAGLNKETPFAASLKEGRTHIAQLYLEHGAQADVIMANGNTPFIQAMDSLTDISVVEMMLKFGTDPNGKNQHGETALFRAINASRFDVVQLLLDRNANPNLPGPKHMLWPAVHKPDILEILLAKGANLKLAPGILELATSINSVEAVEALLKHKADPNAKKDGIYTPLCSAIRDDRENLVDKLLAVGADPNLAALDYPTFKCVSYHRPHLLTKVLKAGANPHHPKGIIEKCIEQNEIDCLAILLEHGANVNERNAAGHTALTTAIKNNNLEVLDLLLHQGADPAVRGQEWPISLAVGNPEILARLLPHIETRKINKGALERAVMADELDSVKLLLAKGVDVEDKNAGVFSPLTTSIREDRKTIFRFLLDEAGADPNSPGEHLPIIKAIRRHRADDLSYIRHLIERGADMNLMYRGWNAVLQALENGETQVFKLLAESGIPDLAARDEEGRSVIEIMQERGMKDELEILLGGPAPSPEIREALSQLRDMVKE
jgi:ankyrin repeat protein